ncbi:hypothetical protein LCGC14_0691760 [marine sediment metagenome]|uniref:Uncharacterized protein n=1 Tax=marine sediment metagenome TaxID=412755 RepID=A0A0F9R5K8_9ZZZZ
MVVAVLFGPLVGAGIGTFFGLRGAINGLAQRSKRMEGTLVEVRDYTRDTSRLLEGTLGKQVGEIHTEVTRGD